METAAESWSTAYAAIIARGDRRIAEARSIEERINIRFDTLLELMNAERDATLAALNDVRRHRSSKRPSVD